MKTEEMVILISFVGTGLLIMILLMWFMSTYYRRIWRSFREPAETNGTILDIWVERDRNVESQNFEPYIVTYSYYDGSSLHEKSFKTKDRKRVRKWKVNDKIVVYYDRQKPEEAVTAMQVESEKSNWWKILLGFVVIVLPAVIYVCRTM